MAPGFSNETHLLEGFGLSQAISQTHVRCKLFVEMFPANLASGRLMHCNAQLSELNETSAFEFE